MRNHKMFYLVSSLVFSMLVLNLGYVQAQTPRTVPIFDPASNPGSCNLSGGGIDCVDSVIYQDANGNIGIGTTTPAQKLHVVGSGFAGVVGQSDFNIGVVGNSTNFIGVEASTNSADNPGLRVVSASFLPANLAMLVFGRSGTTGKLRIDTNIPDNVPTYSLDVAGPLPNTGNGKVISHGYDTFSSRRWKTNIQTIQGALEKVERLRGVSFDRKKNGAREIGVVAEEVAEVVPEVVGYEENGKDAMSVDYGRLTALLIEAAKEQQSQIAKLKAEVTVLKSQKDAEIANLKARLDKLEGMVRNAAYQTASSGTTE